MPDAISIRERPAEVEDRAVPGHGEGDFISGSKNSHIVTLVERQPRFVSLIKIANKETATVVSALTRRVKRLPSTLRRSLTWDRGHELSRHQSFTVATHVKVYFCDPHTLRGNVAATKTPTGCYDNIFHAVPISRITRNSI